MKYQKSFDQISNSTNMISSSLFKKPLIRGLSAVLHQKKLSKSREIISKT